MTMFHSMKKASEYNFGFHWYGHFVRSVCRRSAGSFRTQRGRLVSDIKKKKTPSCNIPDAIDKSKNRNLEYQGNRQGD